MLILYLDVESAKFCESAFRQDITYLCTYVPLCVEHCLLQVIVLSVNSEQAISS